MTRNLSLSSTFKTPTLGLGLFLVTLAPGAMAQEECGDITCDLGTTCEMSEGQCPEIAILCPEDQPDCNTNPDCNAEPYYYCQPAACETDDDCAEYMACVSRPTRDCPDQKPDCTGLTDEECQGVWADFEAQCTEGERKECGIRWQESCEEATDCGEGFDCIPYEDACSCADSASASDGQDVPPPDCLCEPVQGGYCQPQEQACETDDDCLAHWTCEEVFSGGLCSVDSNGNEDCPEPTSSMQCAPPQLPSSGTPEVLAASASASGPAEIQTLGGDEAATSGGPADTSALSDGPAAEDGADPQAPSEVQDLPMGTADESAQSGVADVAEVGEADNSSDGNAADTGSTSGSAKSSSSDAGGGCTVSNSRGTDGGGLTALLIGLGLAIGARRRRIGSRLWG